MSVYMKIKINCLILLLKLKFKIFSSKKTDLSVLYKKIKKKGKA